MKLPIQYRKVIESINWSKDPREPADIYYSVQRKRLFFWRNFQTRLSKWHADTLIAKLREEGL